MQQSGDSSLALALPVALRRNNEIAFAMEVKLDPFADPPPGGNRSSYSSGSWLDDYADWFNGTFGSGWSEAVGGCLHLVDFGFMPAVVGGSLRTSFCIVGFGDGENDIEMLQQSDIACVIPRPGAKAMDLPHPPSRVITASQAAPHGWIEAAMRALSTIKVREGYNYG